MSIQYPNGKVYMAKQKENASPITKATYSNRGMTLEQDLNDTNQYYLTHGIACIHKKPTPIQIVKVEYPKRSAAMIKEGYFKQPSTTDYNGVYKGKHVDFEAKETQNKTSFPLQNFHLHQIEHMRKVIDQGGITFVIIKFTATDEIYLLDATHLLLFWKRYEGGGRKSITKLEMETNGHLIRQGFQPRIDYLATLDRLYFSV